MLRSPKYDAIVIGAGHNEPHCAAYLGAAGLATLVLERREIVGGCCVTEEIASGCRASTTSYIASMLRPEVIRDLDLGLHGLPMVPWDPELACVGFSTTFLTIALSFVPSPEKANPALAVLEVTGGTAALLLVGAALYWLARQKADPVDR